jgi:formylmethanofuran dehydrogenase subunit D
MSSKKLTVSQIFRSTGTMGERKAVASIRMSGSWLEELGFKSGSKIEVREQPGRIELIAAKEGEER